MVQTKRNVSSMNSISAESSSCYLKGCTFSYVLPFRKFSMPDYTGGEYTPGHGNIHLDRTSQIFGSDVRVFFEVGVRTDAELLKKNGGKQIKRNGKIW